MDKFVVKTPSASLKPKTQSHLPVNITANDRARNYPEGTFHMDDGWLFCSSCNVVVDHLRKFMVDKHLEAASHKPLIICSRIALDTQKASTVRFHLFVIVMVTCIVGMSLSDL